MVGLHQIWIFRPSPIAGAGSGYIHDYLYFSRIGTGISSPVSRVEKGKPIIETSPHQTNFRPKIGIDLGRWLSVTATQPFNGRPTYAHLTEKKSENEKQIKTPIQPETSINWSTISPPAIFTFLPCTLFPFVFEGSFAQRQMTAQCPTV